MYQEVGLSTKLKKKFQTLCREKRLKFVTNERLERKIKKKALFKGLDIKWIKDDRLICAVTEPEMEIMEYNVDSMKVRRSITALLLRRL